MAASKRGLSDYLKERDKQISEEAESSAAPAREAPASDSAEEAESSSVPQYGRRADPAYAQIAASIPAELRRKWRVKLAQEERQQQDVLEELLRGYVEGRFKV